MGEIFISSLKFSWDNLEIFMHENEIFMHENEIFMHEMKFSGMKFFVRALSISLSAFSDHCPQQCRCYTCPTKAINLFATQTSNT